MPDAYLVEIHRFFTEKKEEAKTGLKNARSTDEKAYYQGLIDELERMKAFVSEKYDLDFRNYGEAV